MCMHRDNTWLIACINRADRFVKGYLKHYYTVSLLCAGFKALKPVGSWLIQSSRIEAFRDERDPPVKWVRFS
jgi:hypothetical protein